MARKDRKLPTQKREPTLADGFVMHRYTEHDPLRNGLPIKTLRQLQALVLRANKYVFNDDASEVVGSVVRDVPELLVREARFARAPYSLTWIEFNSTRFWRAYYRDDKAAMAGEHPTHAARVGFLIDENNAYVVSGGTLDNPRDLNRCEPGPFRFILNSDWGDKQPAKWVNDFFWGTLSERLPVEQLDLISRYFGFVGLAAAGSAERAKEWLAHSIGDVRDIVAFLLMLNRPSITHYANALPNSRGYLRNKMIPYMAHTTVTISLSPESVVQYLSRSIGEDVELRRHDVEGHYCHDKTARDYLRIAGCIHDWIDCYSDDWTPWPNAPPSKVNHWLCKVCGGKRWWRRDHERGTAKRGLVIHDQYNVTP